MTRLKDLTEAERKTFRRLRKAFRRSLMGMIKKNADTAEVKSAVIRITAHAIKIGWLEEMPVESKRA